MEDENENYKDSKIEIKENIDENIISKPYSVLDESYIKTNNSDIASDISNEEKNNLDNFSKQKDNTIEFERNKYELLKIEDNLKIYKYSNKERILYKNLINQYFYDYDNFDESNYKNAKILLFIGKTGDGKTTVINALFNIIKDIKIDDKYRFILIKEEEKEKKQAESQTDGLHLYYIKDINNNPIIIIDTQGFGDTRGKNYDDLIYKAFEDIISNLIIHINRIFFIGKSNESRLIILIKYIFSFVKVFFY